MKTAILILAAGKSSRMGTAKQLLPIGKTTLLGNAIESALASNASKTYCVIGSHFEAVHKSIHHYAIEVILNNDYQLGLSSSIKKGVQHIKLNDYDTILIMLGDQPNVNAQYLNRFIDKIQSQPSKIIASSYSDIAGVPAIFPKLYFNQLLQLKGDKGAKDFLNSSKANVIKVDSNQLIDIDTTQEYLDFLKSI